MGTAVFDDPPANDAAPVVAIERVTVRKPGSSTTVRERGVFSLLVLWLVAGLAVDTRSHRESAAIDSFFTSAHALGYAGGLATSLYLLYLVRRYRAEGSGWSSVPIGLQAGLGGIAMYVAGGTGDLIWHTVFGVEQELKILFSPTHLMLMAAMLMLAFVPIRAAWTLPESEGSAAWTTLRTQWPQMLGAGCMAAVLNIFLTYASPYEQAVFTTEVPLLFRQFASFLQVASTLAVFAHTIVFFGIALVMLRRWPLPLGGFTVMMLVPAGSMFVYFDWEYRRVISALIVGAVACDVLYALLQLGIRTKGSYWARIRFRLFAFLGPILFWSSYLLVTKDGQPISWSTEQWTGTIGWTGLLGLGLSVLLLPPSGYQSSYLD
jgi:hypothetical protein